MTMMAAPTFGPLSANERREKLVTAPASRSSTLTDAGRELRISFSGGVFVGEISGQPPAWIESTLEVLERLLEMREGWDSYNARAIDPANVRTAIELAAALMHDRTPAPSVVPTSAGGVQLEWHTRGIDLEIEIGSPSRISACFEDQRTHSAWEAEQLDDFSRLRSALRELAMR